MATVKLRRLEQIKREMEQLNQEALRIVTDAVGHSSREAELARSWSNNIKYALERGEMVHATAMQDTIDDIQMGIECGEHEESYDE